MTHTVIVAFESGSCGTGGRGAAREADECLMGCTNCDGDAPDLSRLNNGGCF